MSRELDNFYLKQEESLQSCLLALRDIILASHPDLTPEWKYKLPFFYLKGEMFCYLWMDKVTKQPYIGFMDGYHLKHPALEAGDRKRVKVLPIEIDKDIPIEIIQEILDLAFQLH